MEHDGLHIFKIQNNISNNRRRERKWNGIVTLICFPFVVGDKRDCLKLVIEAVEF